MKKLFLLVFILLMGIILSSCKGYLYIGDGWQDTPEKALEIEADNHLEEGSLTVVTLLDTWYIDDKAFMLFVSENDTLVEVSFVRDEKDRFHYSGSSEEVLLDKPDTFLLSGEQDQFILSSYNHCGTQAWGYKYTSVAIKVNGKSPKIKSYTFACQGKEWSIDRWWLDNIEENIEIKIESIVE